MKFIVSLLMVVMGSTAFAGGSLDSHAALKALTSRAMEESSALRVRSYHRQDQVKAQQTTYIVTAPNTLDRDMSSFDEPKAKTQKVVQPAQILDWKTEEALKAFDK